MYLIIASWIVNDIFEKEKVIKLYNTINPNGFMFKLRNILYYIPMFTLTVWSELHGTVIITGLFLISMLIFLLCLIATKDMYEQTARE